MKIISNFVSKIFVVVILLVLTVMSAMLTYSCTRGSAVDFVFEPYEFLYTAEEFEELLQDADVEFAEIIQDNTQNFTFRINENMPEYKAAVSIYDGEYQKQIEKILITDENDILIQTIVPEHSKLFMKSTVYFIDVTFDGNLDILIPYEDSAQYIRFDAYIWDSEANQFIHAPSFQNLSNPAIDYESKRIFCRHSGDKMTTYYIVAVENNEFIRTNTFFFMPAHLIVGFETDDESLHVFTEYEYDSQSQTETVLNEFYVSLREYSYSGDAPQLRPYYELESFWDLNSEKWNSDLIYETKIWISINGS